MRRREFLNRPGYNSVAAIYACVEDYDQSLAISDCNHTVSLDVYTGNDESRENTIFKIKKMISVLNSFLKAVEEQKGG